MTLVLIRERKLWAQRRTDTEATPRRRQRLGTGLPKPEDARVAGKPPEAGREAWRGFSLVSSEGTDAADALILNLASRTGRQ